MMKKALVLGNSKGIGLEISRSLRVEGFYVYDISRTTGYDLMEEEGLDKLFKEVKEVDILIGNIGGMGTCGIEEFEEVMKKNYFINVKVMLNYLPNMVKNNYGKVIFISSIFGKEKGSNPAFVASKAAQIAFLKSMTTLKEYKNIQFNTVCPGYIDVGKRFLNNPKNIGSPKDVANLVTFLCGEKVIYINGACIVIDGGESRSF